MESGIEETIGLSCPAQLVQIASSYLGTFETIFLRGFHEFSSVLSTLCKLFALMEACH